VKIELTLPDLVRVVATADHRGNPLTVLLIGGEEVLYAEGHEPDGLGSAAWEGIFQSRLATVLADLLLGSPHALDDRTPTGGAVWHRESPTGQETWGQDSSSYVVRLTQDRDEEAGL
jgi:hypothetical protein